MAEQDIELDIESGEEVIKKEPIIEEDHDDGDDGDEIDAKEAKTQSGEPGDEELDNASDDDERESIRARRRDERKHRKQAQKDREENLRRDLASRDTVINELRAKVDLIERRNSGSEIAQLENAKKQTAQAYNFFKDQIRIATEAGNGAAVADATEKMIQSERKFNELAGYEKAMKQRQAAPQPLDPRLINNAQKWMERNNWYDANAKDQDSEIVARLDARLADEGWDPTTPDYWNELDARVKKYLPHRANSGKITTNKPRSVVQGSGRESSGSQNSSTYKLSADRVSALKDAGLWDDPKQRAEAIKRYRDFDKQDKG